MYDLSTTENALFKVVMYDNMNKFDIVFSAALLL